MMSYPIHNLHETMEGTICGGSKMLICVMRHTSCSITMRLHACALINVNIMLYCTFMNTMSMRQYTLSRPPTIRDHTHLCFQYMRRHAL